MVNLRIIIPYNTATKHYLKCTTIYHYSALSLSLSLFQCMAGAALSGVSFDRLVIDSVIVAVRWRHSFLIPVIPLLISPSTSSFLNSAQMIMNAIRKWQSIDFIVYYSVDP